MKQRNESADADSTDQAPDGAEGGAAPGRRSVVFEIPPGTPRSICRSCKAPCYWIETRKRKRLLVDPNGGPHFATCPDATYWRRAR